MMGNFDIAGDFLSLSPVCTRPSAPPRRPLTRRCVPSSTLVCLQRSRQQGSPAGQSQKSHFDFLLFFCFTLSLFSSPPLLTSPSPSSNPCPPPLPLAFYWVTRQQKVQADTRSVPPRKQRRRKLEFPSATSSSASRQTSERMAQNVQIQLFISIILYSVLHPGSITSTDVCIHIY